MSIFSRNRNQKANKSDVRATSLWVALALLISAAGCSKGPSVFTSKVNSDAAIVMQPLAGHLVIGDASGAPLSQAKVMIGLRENVPFPGNILTTDTDGKIALPKAWTDAQPVTVEAAGFIRATWMGQMPTASALQLRRNVANQKMELKGKTTGFKNLVKDGWVDVGIVFPALRRDQLASLQITDLVSLEFDTMTIMGQAIDIPSNISIPKQEERYFFTITLDKPIFRSYLPEPRTWKMVAAHARFPLEEVVDDLRGGKSFFDVLNYFEFKSASIKDISLSSPSTSQDLSIAATKFDDQLSVTAPRFPSSQTVLAVAVAYNAGLLYPTDVKKLNPSETRKLVTPKGAAGLVVGALRETNAPSSGAAADALSAVIAPNGATTTLDFLELPKAPTAKGSTLGLNPPKASVASVTPAATYATLSKVDRVTSGKTQLDKKSPVWDIYAAGWSSTMELPEMGAPISGSHRWEVLFGASAKGSGVNLGPSIVDGLSHISKSAVDL
ncbi:MAG: hypothetical protein J0L82_11040 [Deltaproteobacteria bacterium]|jgi:hypothetical protein|nr:hypothetical protein [Deltaproteobacteria bacterium]